MPATTRFGKLQRVFDDGNSPLLNRVARLSVLYEDFRIEFGALLSKEGTLGEIDALGMEFRTLYFLRRSLATLVEFQGALTQLVISPEFKEAKPRVSELNASRIHDANVYFQKHSARIKELRNEFGGHFKEAAVQYATSNLSPDTVGQVTWVSTSETRLRLELHFVADIVAGAITSKMGGANYGEEWKAAMTIIADGYLHVLGATLATVNAFLWDRFGA